MGGSWKEDVAGDLVVFRRFVPPYDETRPVPAAAVAARTLDGTPLPEAARGGDPQVPWTSPLGISRGSGVSVRLDRPRRLSALVVGLDPERSPLAVPWVCEADGAVVAHGPNAHGLQWVNGAPRAAAGPPAIPLGDRAASEVRLIFQDSGPPLRVWGLFLMVPTRRRCLPPAGAAPPPSRPPARETGTARCALWKRRAARAASRGLPRLAGRARRRASHRRRVDVESLETGAPLVTAR